MPQSDSTRSVKHPHRDSRQARVSVMRDAQRRAERKRRLLIAGGATLAVVVIIAALVAVKLTSGGSTSTSAVGATAAPPQVVQQVTHVPAAALATVGASGVGSTYALPKPLSGAPALTSGGKPEVFYDGAEFCPYCAAERWPMVVALSRFGTFTGLQATTSSSTDAYPDTPTFSFVGSHYTSRYLTFTPVEDRDRAGKPLQRLTPAQQKLVATYDAPPYVPQGGVPFIDFGGQFLQVSASYDPGVLTGKSMREIAAALGNPPTKIAKSIDGAANALTATICAITKNTPASVCSSPVITALQRQLGGA